MSNFEGKAERHFPGGHALIGWKWKSGEDDANYRIIALPNRPCTIRANAPDITTKIFHRSAGAKRIIPGSQSRAATLP